MTFFMLDNGSKVTSWNSGAQKISGYSAEEIIGHNFSKFNPPAEAAQGHPQKALAQAAENGSYEEEGWRMRKDGSTFMVGVLLTVLRDENAVLCGFSKITRDITERTRAEAQLRESEERFRRSFDDAPIGIALVSPVGRWLKVNRALCVILGYSAEELLKLDFQSITHPQDLERNLDFVRRMLAGEILTYQMEKRYHHKLGHTIFANLSASLVRDRQDKPLYFISQIENITERKRVEQEIAASLKEKDVMLREIHHRVKNTMQIISSILKLQANYISDPVALEVFKDCQDRIRTMALVHEKLYRTEGLARIDFKEYLESLTSLLLRGLAGKELFIQHQFKLHRVELAVDTAIPLGLIANELISNCLKHAFVGRQKGFVFIGLSRYDADHYQLIVKDDGQGLINHFSMPQTNSLGLRLVKILTEQIHGRRDYQSEQGAEFVVTFKHKSE